MSGGESVRMTGILAKFSISLLFVSMSFGAEPQSLKKEKYLVCGELLLLEVAQSEEQRNVGLMHRTQVPKGTGMLFIFEKEQPLSFWMKNVPMDIDIAYFDSKGSLLNFHTMKGTSPLMMDRYLQNYPSKAPAKFAVEVEKGFYSKVNTSSCRLIKQKSQI